MATSRYRLCVGFVLLTGMTNGADLIAAPNDGELTIAVADQDTKQPLAARMHLRDSQDRPVIPPKVVSWKDHFVFFEKITLELKPGHYRFTIERGPEYRSRTGDFTIEKNAVDNHIVLLERFVDMKKEGWWSGDLHIHRKPEDIELLMQAEDLHIAPVITWWNNQNLWENKSLPEKPLVQFDVDRFYHVMAGEYEKAGGALLFFNLERPLPLQDPKPIGDSPDNKSATKKKSVSENRREHPPGAKFLELARQQQNAHVDVEKPFWWDVPIWIANGHVDSIGLANNHQWRGGGMFNEAWGKARDRTAYPDPHGNGRWSQDIYYHLLNCGLRIPPSAGSASGVLDNPVAYNRVYVYCGEQLTWDRWWQGLREGKVVVTNGPLLRPRVNGQLPGHVFKAAAGEEVSLTFALELGLAEKVDYLEIVNNGRVVQTVPLREYAEKKGKLPPVTFDKSGWCLIRAVTNNQTTFRFGSSGPYYVKIGDEPRISKESAQFFGDWVQRRTSGLQVEDPVQRDEVLQYHQRARAYWQDLLSRANAE
jgi:hypothetical protein